MWLVLAAMACVAVTTAVAVIIHDFFEGETLIADIIDEYRLSRTNLATLDTFWAGNSNRSDCVISLTTIPSRISLLAPTLKSLMRQTRAPKRIVLNLPRMSKREGVPYVVPEFLSQLKSVEIARCEDLGPATKAIPTLLREAPDQLVIIVDDDRIYPASLVADLEDASLAERDAAFGMSGWVVPEDFIDKPTTIWSNLMLLPPAPVRARRLGTPFAIDILQGLSGYILRPRFFDLAELTDYSGAPPEAFFVDDVWISGHCNVDRFVTPSRRYNYQPKLLRDFYRRTSLGLINRGPGGNARRHNSIVTGYLARRWRVGGNANFQISSNG